MIPQRQPQKSDLESLIGQVEALNMGSMIDQIARDTEKRTQEILPSGDSDKVRLEKEIAKASGDLDQKARLRDAVFKRRAAARLGAKRRARREAAKARKAKARAKQTASVKRAAFLEEVICNHCGRNPCEYVEMGRPTWAYIPRHEFKAERGFYGHGLGTGNASFPPIREIPF